MKKPVDVYLAGGMRTGWQEDVKRDLKKLHDAGLVRWSDPRENDTRDPKEYEPLDMMRVETADIIFGYAEDGNPGLYALCVELAFGKAKGAKTLLVNLLKEETDPKRKRYFSFTGVVCDFQVDNLNAGVQLLEKMIYALAGER